MAFRDHLVINVDKDPSTFIYLFHMYVLIAQYVLDIGAEYWD